MRKTKYLIFILLISSCMNKQEAIPIQENDSVKQESPSTAYYEQQTNNRMEEEEKATCSVDEKSTRLDSISEAIIKNNGGIKDSVFYKFSLDNELNSEGNIGTAIYKKGKLKIITLHIYSDSGQCEAKYYFKTENKINVCEKHFSYIKTINDIKNYRGDPQTNEYCSYVDKEGNLLSGKISMKNKHAIDVFPLIMYHVPYNLRK